MRNFRRLVGILLLLIFVLMVSSAADAADWTTEVSGGGDPCNEVGPGRKCFVDTAGATTSALIIDACRDWVITVWETATSVMPEKCVSTACTFNRPLMILGLTGLGDKVTLANGRVPVSILRLVTTDSVVVSFECGHR